jgi:hypothetical protein
MTVWKNVTAILASGLVVGALTLASSQAAGALNPDRTKGANGAGAATLVAFHGGGVRGGVRGGAHGGVHGGGFHGGAIGGPRSFQGLAKQSLGGVHGFVRGGNGGFNRSWAAGGIGGFHHHHFRHNRAFGFGGAPYYGGGVYGYYAYGDCHWLHREAIITGSPYWWHRYEVCLYG